MKSDKTVVSRWQPFIYQNVWFSAGLTTKMETCAIMEREARKVKEKEYASNSKEQVCLRNATEDMENTYNEKGMGNRMQSKHQSLR